MRLRKPSIARHLFAALAVAAMCGSVAPEAEACGGGWWPEIEIDYRIQGIARAEKDLKKGNYDNAAASVLRMIPHIGAYKKTTRDPIINRALHVLAVATTRKGGKLNIAKQLPKENHGTWLAANSVERRANLLWSVRTLRAVAKLKKKDVVIKSQLGEAMAQVDGMRWKGYLLLERLAQRDLLTSPEAYNALADLRARAGDQDGRLAALDRCRTMAKDSNICTLPANGNS